MARADAPRRGTGPDGVGRCFCLSVALRGVGRRDLRGHGLRPAVRRDGRGRLGGPARAGRAGRASCATFGAWRPRWNDWAAMGRFGPNARARPVPRPKKHDWPRYHAAILVRFGVRLAASNDWLLNGPAKPGQCSYVTRSGPTRDILSSPLVGEGRGGGPLARARPFLKSLGVKEPPTLTLPHKGGGDPNGSFADSFAN